MEHQLKLLTEGGIYNLTHRKKIIFLGYIKADEIPRPDEPNINRATKQFS